MLVLIVVVVSLFFLFFFFFFSFLFLFGFDHLYASYIFENEIYLIFLTLGLLCCVLCRCQIVVVAVGAIAGPIALRRARL